MAFPDSPLELTARAAFGADLTVDPSEWSWTTLTCAHPAFPSTTISRLVATPITITRGVAVGGTQQQTTSAQVELLNNDGALTPGLVTSPHWPYVDAGTPFQLQLRTDTSPYVTDTFTRTVGAGSWGTADSGEAWTATTAARFSTNGTKGLVTFNAVNISHRARMAAVSLSDVDITVDVAPPAVSTGSSLVIGPMARYTDINNLLWTSAEFQTGGTVLLSARVTTGGVQTIPTYVDTGVAYTAGTTIRVRFQVVADRMRAKAWLASGTEPDDWDYDIRQTSVTAAGNVGMFTFADVANTNTLPFAMTVDNFTVQQPTYDRLEGYIADVRPSFLPQPDGTTWSTVIVDVAGVGSRLEKNQSPTFSPLRRSVQLATVTPVAYWPLEDDEGSTFGASAFPGGANMTVTGPAVFGFSGGTPVEQYLSRYGSKPMVSVAAGARLSGVVPTSAVTTQWAITVVGDFFAPNVGGGLTEMRIMEWQTPSGTYNRWALVALASYGYEVRAYQDSTSTVTTVVTTSALSFLSQTTYTVQATQSGSDIAVELLANDNSWGTGTLASATQAPITRVTLNPDRTNTTASTDPLGIRFVVGHPRVVDDVSVHDTPFYDLPGSGTPVSAIFAWYLEPAHLRLSRLCDEERVSFDYLGDLDSTNWTVLNAQQDGGFTDLTTAAVEAESGGLLYEAYYGYRYLPRSARYNRPVDLTIDLATYAYSDDTDPGDVLVPQLDTRAANYWTVARTNGSTATWAADATFRKRRGTIQEQRTLDVLTDGVLQDHAGWRVHLGVDGQGANYPSVPLDLAANPSYIDAWLACDMGSRVQRTNQPAIAGSGTIDQVIEGWAETISPTSWSTVMSASPGSVWDVAVWDDAAFLWQPSLTTLSAPGLTTTAMSFTMSGEAWTTGSVSLLFDIDGEHISVSNISGSGTGPYTATVSARSVNGRVAAHLTGAAVTLANPSRWAL